MHQALIVRKIAQNLSKHFLSLFDRFAGQAFKIECSCTFWSVVAFSWADCATTRGEPIVLLCCNRFRSVCWFETVRYPAFAAVQSPRRRLFVLSCLGNVKRVLAETLSITFWLQSTDSRCLLALSIGSFSKLIERSWTQLKYSVWANECGVNK